MIGPTPSAFAAIATVDQQLRGIDHQAPRTVAVRCVESHTVAITIVPTEWHSWRASPNPSLERHLPSATRADRELFLSGICGQCWSKWFETERD